MAKPKLSLCVIFRDNEDTIDALLRSVHGAFDELIFVDTGCNDLTAKRIRTYLSSNKKVQGRVLPFEWCDDFSAARQFSFEAATGEWRMFLDTDDVLENGESLRTLVQQLEARAPEVCGVFLPYAYAKDENIETLRLVRWADGWAWRDAIHERLNYEGSGKANLTRSQDVAVRHRQKNKQERDWAIVRNAQIALREYQKTDDLEYRARLARTIAMQHAIQNDPVGARPYWEEVVSLRANFPDGRKAASDLMRFHLFSDKNPELAEKYAKIAGPSYEAINAFFAKDYKKCVRMQVRGAAAGEQTTHEGFHFEQVLAPLCMASSLKELGAPAEQIEAVLNKVRPDKRREPDLIGEVAALRAHIDRITILVPGTPQPFSGDSDPTSDMLGGSEEAVFFLSRALARAGRNVRVFGVLPPHSVPGKDLVGVDWQPVDAFNLLDEHGTLVVWRSGRTLISILEEIRQREFAHKEDPSALPVVGIGNGSFWLHDRATGTAPPVGLAAARACDSVVVLSESHKAQIIDDLGEDPGNFVVLSNGINPRDFPQPPDTPEDWPARDPNRVVYSSCPSRGLLALFSIWPKVKSECPDAYLDVYYSWEQYRRVDPAFYEELMRRYEEVRPLGVMHHGGVGHAELHKALLTANVWAYSHFSNVGVETSCISAVKAQAAGATVLTVPNSALPETVPEAVFCEDLLSYRKALVGLLQNPVPFFERACLSRKAMDRFSWDKVAEDFSRIWTVRPALSQGESAATVVE